MKNIAVRMVMSFAVVTMLATPGYGQNLQNCYNQCYSNYTTRSNYCYGRWGASYEGELCMMNVWEEYSSCTADCDSTYGSQTAANVRPGERRALTARCARKAEPATKELAVRPVSLASLAVE